MAELWPALCTAFALALLLLLIMRFGMHAFAALLAVSLGLGLAAGMEPVQVVDAMGKGVGDILGKVAIILALGSMLGRMLEVSGGAELIARTLVDSFGVRRAPIAILFAGFLIGIPVMFNVGFLLLMPIMWRLQKQTGQSLLYYHLPLSLSLAATHSLIPTHPGLAGAVATLGGADPSRTMMQTLVFGSLMTMPLLLLSWLTVGRFWAKRQFVSCPEALSAESKPAGDSPTRRPVAFRTALLIVTLPLILGLAGFAASLLEGPGAEEGKAAAVAAAPGGISDTTLTWLRFFGKAEMALLIPTALAFWLLGMRRGLHGARLAKIAEEALRDVGSIVFLFGAAGAFKEVIQATGAGRIIGTHMMAIPGLSPVMVAYLVAVLMRLFLGSATAAILTAAAIVQGLAQQYPGFETLLVLGLANGVNCGTQPADSGFWMIKEYGNLSVRDVMFRFNACKALMSLTGLGLLLVAEAWLRA